MDSLKTPDHPYYPVEAKLVGYLANKWSVPVLVGGFAVGWGLILLMTWIIVSIARPNLRKGDKIAVLWFVLSMCLDGRLEVIIGDS